MTSNRETEDRRDLLETTYLEPDLSTEETLLEILPDGTKSFESNLKEKVEESAPVGVQPMSSIYSLENVQAHLEYASIQLSQLHFILSQLEQNQLLEVTPGNETEEKTSSSERKLEKAFMKQAAFIKSANYVEERYNELSRVVEKQQGRLEQLVRLRQRCTGIRIFTSGIRVEGSVAIDENRYNLNLEDPKEKFIEKQDIVESSIATGPGELLGCVRFPAHLDKQARDRSHEKKILLAIIRSRFFAFQRKAFRYLVNSSKKCNQIFYYYQNRVHLQIHPSFRFVFGLIRMEEQVPDSLMNGKWEALSYLLCEWSLLSSIHRQRSLNQLMKGESRKDFSMDMNQFSSLLYTLESTEQFELAADSLESHFGLQLEWLYGKELGQVEVKFTARKTDGIGPQGLLGTGILVSPSSIWFTPAFRVYCQGALEVLRVFSAYYWSWTLPEEDYPPSFECPVSQLSSIVTLLLCGRLLHSLELMARCHKYVFEVDRQGLALAVRGRRTFVTLWLEVIPYFEKHGEMEEIHVQAYLNGEYVSSMKGTEMNSSSWFQSLLNRLDLEDKRIFQDNVK